MSTLRIYRRDYFLNAPSRSSCISACTPVLNVGPPPGRALGTTGLGRSGLARHFLALGREMRLSYLPPLMVYVAAGIAGLTAIVAAFYIKERLGLSAEFLAGLGFWAGLPWALKVPLGHLVDLLWRWKAALVFVGAGLIAVSLGIMIGLLGHADWMRAFASVEAWCILSTLLAASGPRSTGGSSAVVSRSRSSRSASASATWPVGRRSCSAHPWRPCCS